ncbi:hypothetical protein STRDD10_01100 [Streptococcus sp. DD10]|nr:hypothetical protein STRDD10_01100 [Streptococcus sp. DD10]
MFSKAFLFYSQVVENSYPKCELFLFTCGKLTPFMVESLREAYIK